MKGKLQLSSRIYFYFSKKKLFSFVQCLGKTTCQNYSERSILAVLIATGNHTDPSLQSISFLSWYNLPFNKVTTPQCYTCHSPFSTIITVSPVLVVRADVVVSVLIAGYLSSCGVELLCEFDSVVGLTAIFPGSLQSKLLFEQSVEKVEELFQFIVVAA